MSCNEDLIAAVRESRNDNVQTNSEDDLPLSSVSHQKAINCLNKALEWTVENKMFSSDQLVLQSLREKQNVYLEPVSSTPILEYALLWSSSGRVRGHFESKPILFLSNIVNKSDRDRFGLDNIKPSFSNQGRLFSIECTLQYRCRAHCLELNYDIRWNYTEV
ncbi:hypothetical protein ABEB36_002413 [Hypothenemus hampei]|uniref:Uncharacterized protein n=1 Tax=Hypothenemus hampei TaxID=57062 RepID=A0ABD1F5P2_HYPHA